MANPNFINMDGDLSDDGRKLSVWLSAHLPVMEAASAAELNTYAGPVQDFFTRHKLNAMTAEQYVKDFRRTLAMNAWRVMEAVEAQAMQEAKLNETADTTSELVKQLEAMREELAALKAAQQADAPAPKRTKKQPVQEAQPVEEADSDDDAEDSEEVE